MPLRVACINFLEYNSIISKEKEKSIKDFSFPFLGAEKGI